MPRPSSRSKASRITASSSEANSSEASHSKNRKRHDRLQQSLLPRALAGEVSAGSAADGGGVERTNRSAATHSSFPPTPSPSLRLPASFLSTDSVTLAQKLLGQRLVRILDDGTRLSGIIVETEAYLGAQDRAAHSFGGRKSERNAAMFGPPGTAYVYFIYGVHYCLNIVCGRVDEPIAVLLRALEPTEGLDAMRRLRYPRGCPKPRADNSDLCSGPGKLCQAMAIDRSQNGLDLSIDTRLFLERNRRGPWNETVVGNSPRIGVDYAGPWAAKPLRWFWRASPHVSGPRIQGRIVPRPKPRVKFRVGPRR
jgi:DNA-3-methyladenine glycosylase